MYELIYILPVDYDDKKIKNATQEIVKTIGNHNGALVKDDFLGEKLLQYPVKNHSRGKYFKIEFTIPVDYLKELKKDLSLNKEVLRYLLSKKEIQAKEKVEKGSEKDKVDNKKDYSIVKSEKEKKKEEPKKEKKADLDQLDAKLKEILE